MLLFFWVDSKHGLLIHLQDLAAGYMSGKLLLKLDAISYILTHHTSEYFTFLNEPANGRARTIFYHVLARLLFMEDSPARFKTFVAPLHQVSISQATFYESFALSFCVHA